tara:strand:+ start:636 stop:833 length:198 start_codon:yes stop_codon:yes gene_type:complete
MRLVTAKPPKIFILAINIAKPDKTRETVSVEDTWVNAPIIIILLTAFVTDIKGVWRDAVTFQITM